MYKWSLKGISHVYVSGHEAFVVQVESVWVDSFHLPAFMAEACCLMLLVSSLANVVSKPKT